LEDLVRTDLVPPYGGGRRDEVLLDDAVRDLVRPVPKRRDEFR